MTVDAREIIEYSYDGEPDSGDKGTAAPRLTIKDLDPCDRPYEKAEKFGCASLAKPDLLAILLRTGLPGKPITKICQELMKDCGNSLTVLQRKGREELMSYDGIGAVKAIQIEAALQLAARLNEETLWEDRRPVIRNSTDIFNLMAPKIGNLDHEEIHIVCLSRSNKVEGTYRISSGSATATVFDMKKCLKMAILKNAEGLMLCHNHPSGNMKPSPQDDAMTRSFATACKTLDLNFLDHIIVSTSAYYSYRDQGRL